MNKHTIKYNKEDIFGPIQSREDSIALLKSKPEIYHDFLNLKPDFQDLILNFLSGNSTLKATTDVVFKHTFDFDFHPERLEKLISSIIGINIHIDHILPNEGIRQNETSSFVSMDIICRDDQGSIINVEMQKLGYDFPGERASCYISDMTMRQYNHLRNKYKEKFTYRQMRPVYLIVLMEKSSSEFLSAKPEYFHQRITKYSSGIEISELEKVYYISLDIYDKYIHNIDSERDAWLTFLSTDNVDKIIKLCTLYPEFKELYDEIKRFRSNPKELIDMVSEMIRTLDHNTIMYMVDEMKIELKNVGSQLSATKTELDSTKAELDGTKAELDGTKAELDGTKAELDGTKAELDGTKAELDGTKAELDGTKAELEATKAELEALKASLKR